MLFNSLDFAIFLPIVFVLYWFVTKSLKAQNLLIVVASYLFYGWWDYRFVSLIILSTVVDFIIGNQLAKQESTARRKALLWTSMAVNLGLLGFFKYYNFFLENFIQAFTFFGAEFKGETLNIVLPVGISFYTFQTMSYTIDIYRRKLEPTKDFISFAAFVSFFPQLVAGPIERATNLLPQILNRRKFDYAMAVDGCRQILWGLVKKVVIADGCAEFANVIFNNYHDYNGSTLLLGAIFFTFQIYGDFSGYSDIAIGTSRLFGFNLMQNFAFPYFSRDIAEFWRRWHISLSTWFRDYLYIPLGGSRGGTAMRVRNTFIIFGVSGFWHGANWTYIVWGLLNALYFLPLLLTNNNRNNIEFGQTRWGLPSVSDALKMLLTFCLAVLAWIIFRASTMTQAIEIIGNILSPSLFQIPDIQGLRSIAGMLAIILVFLIAEWVGRNQQFALQKVPQNAPLRYLLYFGISISVLLFGNFSENQFIYFQF